MSDAQWVILDEYSFDGGDTVEYRHPRTCKSKQTAEARARQLERLNRGEVGFARCVVRPADELHVSFVEAKESRRTANAALDRAKRLQDVTADHLRKARGELHNARGDVAEAERLLRRWSGNETSFERQHAPAHYQGDGLVTCSRALHSAMSQEECPRAVPMPAMAAYWWGCAFKYLWRMWSKDNPQSDGEKAIDCIHRALRAWGGR